MRGVTPCIRSFYLCGALVPGADEAIIRTAFNGSAHCLEHNLLLHRRAIGARSGAAELERLVHPRDCHQSGSTGGHWSERADVESHFRDHALLNWGNWSNPIVEGFVYWVVGTFGVLLVAPASPRQWLLAGVSSSSPQPEPHRGADVVLQASGRDRGRSILAGFLIYCVFGGSALAGAWTSFFGATGEYCLSFEHPHAEMARLFHPATRASLDPS